MKKAIIAIMIIIIVGVLIVVVQARKVQLERKIWENSYSVEVRVVDGARGIALTSQVLTASEDTSEMVPIRTIALEYTGGSTFHRWIDNKARFVTVSADGYSSREYMIAGATNIIAVLIPN